MRGSNQRVDVKQICKQIMENAWRIEYLLNEIFRFQVEWNEKKMLGVFCVDVCVYVWEWEI